MPTVAEAFTLALQYRQAGRLPEAEALYRQVLQAHPDHPDALNNLGNVLQLQGRFEAAVLCYRQAVALRPDSAETHNNMAGALYAQGKLEEAAACYRQALATKPDYVEACLWLGKVRQEQGRHAEAVGHYQRALALGAANADVFNHLGVALQANGKQVEAIAAYQQALALKPDFAEVYNNLGNVLREQGQLDEAVRCYQQALGIQPGYAVAYYNIGQVMGVQEKQAEAVAAYRQALALKPGFAEAHNNLGNMLRDQGKLEEAVTHYRAAIEHNPSMVTAYKNLGALFRDQGRVEEAVVEFRYALRLKPDDGLKILIATMLPVIYQSKEHLTQVRRRYEQQVSCLLEENLVLSDPSAEVGTANFYLAYQGLNDRDPQQLLSKLYEKACPSLNYVAPHCESSRSAVGQRRIKIGIISRHFWNHTVGSLMRGIVAELSRQIFSVTVFPFLGKRDSVTESIIQRADRSVVLPPTLEAARHAIAKEKLDILFYADIGMEPLTYFLAYSRLAPVQCVTWGHPVTTGIKCMDYFVSSELLESKNADQHYSEKLVRLKHLPTFYYRPQAVDSALSKNDLGMNGKHTLYVCPQSLFKCHPDFDEILGQILRTDRKGQIIFIEGHDSYWTDQMRKRMVNSMPDLTSRVRYIPRQSHRDFMRLLAMADVILDTPHWSGGNTTFEALSFGVPIVTLPSEFMRGRVTYGCYRQMGILDCVAETSKEYANLAVRLGTDRQYRADVKAKILANNGVLYENGKAVRRLEQFLVEAHETARGVTGKA